jgi:four helix bundle protein
MKKFPGTSVRFPVTGFQSPASNLRLARTIMKSYRELDRMTLVLPKFELHEEGSQIRKSSKLVTAMVVEGYGRKKYKAEFIKYLVYSQAECDETIVHPDFLFETESLKDKIKYNESRSRYDSLSKRINKFIQWVEGNWNDFPSPETGNL